MIGDGNPFNNIDTGNMPNLVTGNLRGEGSIDMVVGTAQGNIKYYYLNRCEPAPECSGRGSCEYSSFTHTTCKCVADLSAAGSQCESCSKGTIELPYKGGSDLQIAKPPECQECPSGYWSDIEEYTPNAICNPCQPGYFDNSSGGGTSINVCRSCPIGYNQPIQSLTFCEPCLPGKYQTDKGATLCIDCPSGYKQEKNGRQATYANAPYSTPGCQLCTPGKYQPANDGQPLCLECNPGMYGVKHGMKRCDECSKGMYRGSSDTNKTKCLACKAGQHQNKVGQSSCLNCGPGMFVAKDGKELCTKCKVGMYRGNSEINTTRCLECKAGQATNGEDGQPFCLLCDLGKYMNATGAARCFTCPPLTYQNNKGQKQCLGCNNKNIPNQDQTSCITPPWNTEESCNDDHYLNDSSKDNMDWTCVPCPSGSSCTGPISWSGVHSKFGWSRCANDHSKFVRCSFPGACLGRSNLAFAKKFPTLAIIDHNETCNAPAYVNNSQICGQCGPHHSHVGLSGRCDQCPTPGQNTGIAIGGVVAGIICIIIYIKLTLSNGGSLDESDGAKSIGLSFIQLISLLVTFPIPWYVLNT